MPDMLQLVDPATIIPHFLENGLDTKLLRRCNSIQYKYIDGAGEGYLLMREAVYQNNVSNGRISSLILGGPNISLYVLDVYYFDHPSTTGTRLVIVHVAEPKHKLSLTTVDRNFNVLVRRSYINFFVDVVPPDATPKTLLEILNSITGISCTYNSTAITPYDVFIQGMTKLEAVDKLCAAHGLLWWYDGTSLVIYDGDDAVAPSYNKITDICDNSVNPSFKQIAVVYPILDCCLQEPEQFHTDSSAATNTAGNALTTYYPYFPAILDNTSSYITNDSDLTARRTILSPRFQAIDHLADSLVTYPYFNSINMLDPPKCLTLIYTDYGDGPKTVLLGRDYPYLKKPEPTITDNQAKNWIGYLYEGYKGSVMGFWVVPTIGIDGKIPKSLEGQPGVWVVNLYEWDYGAEGATIRVEWECTNYRWIPLQQEYICPPSDPAPPQTPPPESEEPTYPLD